MERKLRLTLRCVNLFCFPGAGRGGGPFDHSSHNLSLEYDTGPSASPQLLGWQSHPEKTTQNIRGYYMD